MALYRGISQDLAWVNLSKVHKDHPEIELKYLPSYQQKQVKATIAEGGLPDARSKIDELAVQASACEKQAAREKAESQNKTTTGSTKGTDTSTSASKGTPDPSNTKSPDKSKTAPTPNPGPSLSEEEQKVVSLCGKQQ